MSEEKKMLSTFLKQVTDHFGFLEHDFGFHRVMVDDRFARWENNEVFVQVQFDAERSYEVGAEVGQSKVLFNGKERPFDLGEVARMAGNSWSRFRVLHGHNEDTLDNALNELADVVKLHGHALLHNAATAFAILAKQREQECSDYAVETELRQMKATAEKAWREHDYPTIVDLYGQHKSHLSPVEVKRYEVALKRVVNE